MIIWNHVVMTVWLWLMAGAILFIPFICGWSVSRETYETHYRTVGRHRRGVRPSSRVVRVRSRRKSIHHRWRLRRHLSSVLGHKLRSH